MRHDWRLGYGQGSDDERDDHVFSRSPDASYCEPFRIRLPQFFRNYGTTVTK
jgi:hypothetical protein